MHDMLHKSIPAISEIHSSRSTQSSVLHQCGEFSCNPTIWREPMRFSVSSWNVVQQLRLIYSLHLCCFDTLMALPGHCHGLDTATALSKLCHIIVMAVAWDITVVLTLQCHGTAMALPWHCCTAALESDSTRTVWSKSRLMIHQRNAAPIWHPSNVKWCKLFNNMT